VARAVVAVGALVRKPEFVEYLVQAGAAQGDMPLLVKPFPHARRGPLVAVEPKVRRRLVEQDMAQDLPPLRAQGLRARPLLGGEQGVEAAVEVAVQPFFQRLALDALGPADLDQALAVPDGLQGQQPTPAAMLLMPIEQRLPPLPILGRPVSNANFAVHGASSTTACYPLKYRRFLGVLGVSAIRVLFW